MRLKNKKTYYLRKKGTVRDNEGGAYPGYADPQVIKAYIYPASGKVQAEIYGDRLNYILNMLYDGTVALQEKDGICVNVEATEEPDYRVISIKSYSGHKLIELERIT